MSAYAATSALATGLVLSLLGFGVFLSFRILRFPDLTVEGSFALGGCVTVAGIRSGVPALIATAGGAAAGAVAGLLTGVLATRLKVPPVVAAILVMSAAYSGCLVMLGAPNVPASAPETVFGGVENVRRAMGLDSIGAMMMYPVLFLALSFIVKLLLDRFLHSEQGMALRTAGSNPRMAASYGVDPDKALRQGLMLANGLVGLAGALFAQRERFADVNMGFGMLVVGLASVFIGEAMEDRISRRRGIAYATTAVVVGSIIHRFAIALAYEAGLPTGYFNALTSVLVLSALCVPRVRRDFLIAIRRAA